MSLKQSTNGASFASEEEVKEFRRALVIMNLSLNAFCEKVALEEGENLLDEENNIAVNVKKSFSRKLNEQRLNQYWHYLSLEENFSQTQLTILPNASKYLNNSKYSAEILQAFKN